MATEHEANRRETRSMRRSHSHRTRKYNQENDKAVMMNTLHNKFLYERGDGGWK